MYDIAVHANNVTHHHSHALDIYITIQGVKSPEDVMFGFEKWKLHDGLVLI
jgi:hypothetical protein